MILAVKLQQAVKDDIQFDPFYFKISFVKLDAFAGKLPPKFFLIHMLEYLGN